MEKMGGRFRIETTENMDEMRNALGMTEEMMKDMTGSTGTTADIMVHGDNCTVERSDGKVIMYTLGKEFEMPVGDMKIKAFPKMEGEVLVIMLTFPGGKLIAKHFHLDGQVMRVAMTYKNVTMKMCCKRI